MNTAEADKILTTMMVSYTNFKPVDTVLASRVWAESLKEYSYQTVYSALMLYIRSDTSGFAPSPGQILERIRMVTAESPMNEMEAWSLVKTALRNSGYHADREFAELPPLVQKAVGSPTQLQEWAVEDNLNENVAQAIFARNYREAVNKEHEISKYPQGVQKLIAKNNPEVPRIEAKEPEGISYEKLKGIPEAVQAKIRELEERLGEHD